MRGFDGLVRERRMNAIGDSTADDWEGDWGGITPRLRGRLAPEESPMSNETTQGQTVPLEPAVGPDLLPCPFCGNSPRYLRHLAGHYHESVICDYCGFALRAYSHDEPITAWNTRAPVTPNAQVQAASGRNGGNDE